MYETVHTVVFATENGGGNPCPVTLNADDLSLDQMQEMTLGFGEESVFLCRSGRPDCDFRPYYFMPLTPTEMCVHATLGSVFVLATRGLITKSPVWYDSVYGPLRIDWERAEDGGIDVAVSQFLPKFKETVPTAEELCRALRIREEDLADGPVESVATSRFKLMIPLKSRELLDALEPDFEYLWALCDKYETTGFYPFVKETDAEGNAEFCARQFPKRAGYPEDPATGLAAAALGAYLTAHRTVPVQEGWNRFVIRQGEAMGRPSRLVSQVLLENGEITAVRVCGRAEIVKK